MGYDAHSGMKLAPSLTTEKVIEGRPLVVEYVEKTMDLRFILRDAKRILQQRIIWRSLDYPTAGFDWVDVPCIIDEPEMAPGEMVKVEHERS